MERTRSSSVIVIVRVLGLAGVLMGLIWFVSLATSILLLAGIFILRKSGRLAAFVLKGAKDDAA